MKTKRGKRRGSAILVVLGIVAVVSIVCAMLGKAASQQMHASKITRDAMRARTIAESGLNKVYHTISTNFSLVKNGYSLSEAFDGGTYAVRSGTLAGASENRAQLISEGSCGLGRSVVIADLENRKKTGAEDGESDRYFKLLYDLLVGGTLDMNGNFHADVNAIQANGNVTIGGSALPGTTVSSAGTVSWKRNDGSVVTLSNQSPVEILTAALTAAINEFIQYAKDNNAVYSSGSQIPAAPPGGVAYCIGDGSGWSRTGTGCFIFAGDASFQGNAVNVSSVDGYPALIVLGTGEVKFNSGTEIHGAILIPNGSAKLNGHAEFYGAILVGQGWTGNGTADLFSGLGQGFTLPPKVSSSDNVVVTAWH